MTDGRVLLTGASGLLGTWLRRTAPVGTEVVGLTHRTRLRDSPEVIADLRDPGAVVAAVHLVRPSLVIHAAYARDPVAIVAATQNVVDAAQKVGVDVLYVSSDAVFSGDGSPRRENAPRIRSGTMAGGRRGQSGSSRAPPRRRSSSGCRWLSRSTPKTTWLRSFVPALLATSQPHGSSMSCVNLRLRRSSRGALAQCPPRPR